MLHAFKQVITDFDVPKDKEFRPALMSHLNNQIDYLIHCREKSIGMSTAIKYVKTKINMVKAACTTEEAKQELIQAIDEFKESRIRMADLIIADSGSKFVSDGDIVMTYASSHVVEAMLKKAHDDGKTFRVILVDSRPKFEGRAMLSRLVKYGIDCGYVLLTALAYVLKDVTKVFLGAAGLLSNGTVMSRLGTAVVAMMAESQDLPVIVCCETYKFCERVQLDSICNNEIGNPDELVATCAREAGGVGDTLADWTDIDPLRLLNLVYDITPMALVTMVITEVGNLPPTAVPVVIREYHKDIQASMLAS
jgi:translation initiation factor eIF-2B subunit delta